MSNPVVGEMRGIRSVVDWKNGKPKNAFQIPYRIDLVPEEGEPRIWNGFNWVFIARGQK